jgi:hypothetical protein
MKNLLYHKKQVREKRRQHTHERAMQRVDAIGAQVLARSQERWDGMLRDLELQRCKLEQRERERIPLPVRQLMAATGMIIGDMPDLYELEAKHSPLIGAGMRI